MSGRRIRAGIVGSGFVGTLHVEALRRLGFVDVVGVAMSSRDKAQTAAADLFVERAYGDYRQLLDDDSVQVVHNCTPNHLHFEINRQALLAGKHVVSEKPLAMNSGESALLTSLADSHGAVNAVNFMHRGYPLVQQARRMVETGELGRLNLIHGSYLQDWLLWDTDFNWRVDPKLGGASRALADIGSHWLDLAQFVAGSRLSTLCADFKTVHPRRRRPAASTATFGSAESTDDYEDVEITTEDYAALLFRLANGASGTMLVSQVSPGRKNRLWFEIDGSRQAAAWDSEQPESLWIGRRGERNELLARDPGLLDPEAAAYVHLPGGHPEGWPDALKNLFASIYTFILEGRDPRVERPIFPTFWDGHAALLVVEAAMRSAGGGGWVEVVTPGSAGGSQPSSTDWAEPDRAA